MTSAVNYFLAIGDMDASYIDNLFEQVSCLDGGEALKDAADIFDQDAEDNFLTGGNLVNEMIYSLYYATYCSFVRNFIAYLEECDKAPLTEDDFSFQVDLNCCVSCMALIIKGDEDNASSAILDCYLENKGDIYETVKNNDWIKSFIVPKKE